MSAQTKLGKILWYDKAFGIGMLQDTNNETEYNIDDSGLEDFIKEGDLVYFEEHVLFGQVFWGININLIEEKTK